MYQQPYAQRPSPGIAAILEFVPGLFGLYGLGHLYAGHVPRGIGLFILGLMYWAFAALVAFFTVGIGLLVLVPVAWLWLIVSTIWASQSC